MTTTPEMSGTEMALRFPETAAATVLIAHTRGGGVANAWEVLASAWTPVEAAEFVAQTAQQPRFAGVDVAGLLRDLAGIQHVTTVTSDSTGYGHDTWACSCGVVNESQFGGMFPIETHVPDGAVQIRVDTSNEED